MDNAVLIEHITKAELFLFIEKSVEKIMGTHEKEDKVYTVRGSAIYLRYSQVTIRKWIKSGRLTAFKVEGSKGIRIRQSELDRSLKEHAR